MTLLTSSCARNITNGGHPQSLAIKQLDWNSGSHSQVRQLSIFVFVQSLSSLALKIRLASAPSSALSPPAENKGRMGELGKTKSTMASIASKKLIPFHRRLHFISYLICAQSRRHFPRKMPNSFSRRAFWSLMRSSNVLHVQSDGRRYGELRRVAVTL